MRVPDRETNPTGPGEKFSAGMIPILHSPGVIRPGQFGPMSVVADRSSRLATFVMSCTGVPSVMQTTTVSSLSIASSIASIAPGAGTKMIDAFAPVSSTACATVSNSGMPSTFVPPAPGFVPATTFVPYSLMRPAWKVPSRPRP